MLKVSIALGRGVGNPVSTVQQMNRAQVCSPWHTCESMQVDGGCIGVVKTCADASAIPCVLHGTNGNRLIFAGSPMLLGGGLEAMVTSLVYDELDAACAKLTRLDGHFVAVFWEACSQRLVVVTGFLGIQPLHMVHNEGKLLLSTDLKGITQSGQYELAPNRAGWGCFVGFGQALGRITQAEGVERVPAATVLTYDVAQDRIDERRYWTWPEGKRGMRLADVDVDHVVDSMAESLRAYMELNASPTSLLSGGTDSRLMMAILRTVQDSPDVLSVMKPGHFGGADGTLALQAARAMSSGRVTVVHSPPDLYQRESFLQYLVMQEIASPVLSLFIPEVALALHRDLHAVWDGNLSGYFLKITTHPPGGFGPYLAMQAVSRDARAWECAKMVFAPRVVDEMFQGFTDALHREVSALPDDEFGVNRFVMGNRVTRRTVVHSTQVYSNTVLPLIAGCARPVVDYAMALPYEIPAEFELHKRIFREKFKEFIGIPYCDEHGVFSFRRFAPQVWLRNKTGLGSYYWGRAKTTKLGARILSSRSVPRQPGCRTNLEPGQVLRLIDLDDPIWNAEGLRPYLAADPRRDWLWKGVSRLVYHFQMWRWIMSGELTAAGAGKFMSQQSEKLRS